MTRQEVSGAILKEIVPKGGGALPGPDREVSLWKDSRSARLHVTHVEHEGRNPVPGSKGLKGILLILLLTGK